MTETLSFPGLGLSFELNRVAFSIAGRPIYWYGIIFGIAFIVASLYILRRTKLFGLDPDRTIDVLLGAVIGGLIGARLYYVIFSGDTYDLMRILNVREGGLALYGGVIGALLAMLLMCKLRKVKLLPAVDLFASGLIIAQAIGRWGNFVNIEAFGSNTTAPWGMTSASIAYYLQTNSAKLAAIGVAVDPTMPVHPTFFYESMWCLLGFVLLMLFTKRRRFDGELTLIYFGWYGLGRAFIEGLRTDSLMMGTIRVSQLLSILLVLAAAVVLFVVRSRIKAAHDPDYLRLYVDTEEGQSILAGTFYPKKEKKGDAAEKEPEEKKEESAAEGEETEADEDAGDTGEQPQAPDPGAAPEEEEAAPEPDSPKE